MSFESLETKGAIKSVGSLAIAESKSSRFVSDFEPGRATVALMFCPCGAGQYGCEEVISSKIPNLGDSCPISKTPIDSIANAESQVRETYLV